LTILSLAFPQQRLSTFHPTSDFQWKLPSKLWKMVQGSDMGVFVAAGMHEGYIKLLFADKGWGGLCIFWSSCLDTVI
jgi:hypothetical protein